jgi:DNA-binding MarR family transcriptional regulator
MAVRGAGMSIEQLGQLIFDAVLHICLRTPRGRRRNGELKEIEFLTLFILKTRSPRIVGDIQRLLGVLPAQMSRILRSLEDRPRPLVVCRINPQDKRKIDVALTPAGMQAFQESQGSRVGAIVRLLSQFSEEELEGLEHILERVHELLRATALYGEDE